MTIVIEVNEYANWTVRISVAVARRNPARLGQ